ncbi:MAG: ABC transporter substrate-binding protein [Pseudomonadota bacterium]
MARASQANLFPGFAGWTLASLLMVAVGATLWTSSAQAEDAAVSFMRRTANELMGAQRQGTAASFVRVINRYGHVPAIGMDALGSYRKGLRPASRKSYYKGLVRFIARYAANESPKYRVSRVEFKGPGVRDGRHVLVDSSVLLADGSRYDVRWMLVPRGKTFRVRDAQVLGFWISPFLTRLFENYIGENGGRVDALVMALNR